MEHAGCQRSGNGARKNGRNPDSRISQNVRHLEHRGSDALGDQTAPAVFPEAHNGKAHHLGATAGHCRAARQASQTQSRADGGRGDGQRQRDTHQYGYQNAHEEGLQLGCPLDHIAYPACGLANVGCNQDSKQDAHQGRNCRGYQNVHLGPLGDQLAALAGDDGNHIDRQRTAGAAQLIAGKAHSDQGEEHQGRRMQGVADRHRDSGATHIESKLAHSNEHFPMKLLTEGLQNRTDQQRSKKTLRHRAHGVDEITLGRQFNILLLEK